MPLVILFLVLATFGVASSAAAAPDPCEFARSLVRARLIDDAIAFYSDEAFDCADSVEARARLGEIVAEREFALATARAAAKNNLPADARAAYLDVLSLDAGSDAARAGLAALGIDKPDDPFLGARLLYAAGFEDEAKAAVIKTLAAGKTLGRDDATGAGSVTNRTLRELGDSPDTLDGAREWARDHVDDAITILIALLVLWCVVNLLVVEPLRRSKFRRKSTLDAPALQRWWRTFTQPRLRIVAGEGEEAKLLALNLQSVVVRASDSNGDDSLRIASYPEDPLDLSAVTELDARLKPVVAALKFASQHDTLMTRVSGGDEDDAARITVEVAAKAEPPQMFSVRSAAAADSARTPPMLGRVAGWLLFTAEEMRPRIRPKAESRLTKKNVYGTSVRESFSAYLGGVEAYGCGDLVEARRLFAQSVQEDPTNARAEHNLALTELLDDSSRLWATGIERLERLLS